MAHPKSRTSKQRKRKRRTHYKATAPTLSRCAVTEEVHQRHHAYWVDGAMYYRGRVVIPAPEIDEL